MTGITPLTVVWPSTANEATVVVNMIGFVSVIGRAAVNGHGERAGRGYPAIAHGDRNACVNVGRRGHHVAGQDDRAKHFPYENVFREPAAFSF